MAYTVITNLSILREGSKEQDYSSDLGVIKGTYTNDAPVKYLISSIAAKGGKVGKLIAVTTPEAMPAFEAFRSMTAQFSQSSGIYVPEPVCIPARENSFAGTISEITAGYTSGDSVCIDTTGGFRNSSYLLMCVVRKLEYSGIKLEKAVYSRQAIGQEEKNLIVDVTYLYKMYDMINAVDAFTNYGDSHGLERYFRDTEEPAVRDVISAMNDFSDMISLCRTAGLTDILARLEGSLGELGRTELSSADAILFRSLIGTVRDKFYMKNDRTEYPDIVRWCLDNRLIQQAVTIYVERMPEYLFREGFFTAAEQTLERIKAEKTGSGFDFYYELFYNSFMMPEKDIPFRKLMKSAAEESGKADERDRDIRYQRLLGGLKSTKNVRKLMELVPPDMAGRTELETALAGFIKFRDLLYSAGKRKEEKEYRDKLPDFPEAEEWVNNNNIPKTVEGFIRTVAQNEHICLILSGKKLNGLKNAKLAFIEGVSEGCIREGFALGEGIAAEKMQMILRDLIFAKTFIRNKLNHASDEDAVSEEIQNYFESYGYPVSGEMSVEDIKRYIYNAIEKLKK